MAYGPAYFETPMAERERREKEARLVKELHDRKIAELQAKFRFPQTWEDVLIIWEDGKYD